MCNNIAYKTANKNKKQLQIMDKLLVQLFVKELMENPRPVDTSKSLYFMMSAIKILEKLGNTMPIQEEIDFIESCLKRYGSRKNVKVYLSNQPTHCHVH